MAASAPQCLEMPNRPFGRAAGAILLLGLILSAAGCNDTSNPAPNDEAPTQSQDDELAAEQSEAMQKLAGLGYLDYSPEVADKSKIGVVHNDRERSSPGYNLYGNPVLASAVLIDETGKVIQEWEHEEGGNWANCELLPNGDLLVPGRAKETDPEVERIRYLLKLSWDGQVIWKREMTAHHDVEVTPRNQVLTLTDDYQRRPIHRRLMIRDALLTLLSQDGKVIDKLSLYDALATRPDVLEVKVKGVKRRRRGDERVIDLFHANSIEWMRHKQLESRDPIYSASNVLVSIRHQDAVVIIDWDAKKLVWAWGPDEIIGPHDASMLENGNILLFDNGLRRRSIIFVP